MRPAVLGWFLFAIAVGMALEQIAILVVSVIVVQHYRAEMRLLSNEQAALERLMHGQLVFDPHDPTHALWIAPDTIRRREHP